MNIKLRQKIIKYYKRQFLYNIGIIKNKWIYGIYLRNVLLDFGGEIDILTEIVVSDLFFPFLRLCMLRDSENFDILSALTFQIS
jgi:hypothetical protein